MCNKANITQSYLLMYFKNGSSQAVVAHAFNPSTWEAEAGGFLSLRPAWSTK
jgi:major histocompatibility complex class I